MKPQGSTQHGTKQKSIVVVVDSDEGVLRRLQLLLESPQLGVVTLPSAESLLLHLEKQRPNCVIAEVFLPGISGIELLGELKRRHVQVPVIVMTSHSKVTLAVEAIQMGEFDVMEKPILDWAVVRKVREALRTEPTPHGPSA